MRAPLAILLTLTAVAPAAGQVRVMGEIESAPVSAGEGTLLEVLSGTKLALTADLAHVVVLRVCGDGPALAVNVDVRAMLTRGDTTHNVALHTGDAVFVPSGRATSDGDRGAIDAAIDALAADGDEQDRASVLCLRALHAKQAAARVLAVRELCEVDPDHRCVLPTLRDAIADRDVTVVREAVTALGVLGPRARDAADALRELCDHEDAQVRARAKVALQQVSGERR